MVGPAVGGMLHQAKFRTVQLPHFVLTLVWQLPFQVLTHMSAHRLSFGNYRAVRRKVRLSEGGKVARCSIKATYSLGEMLAT